jgi:hypothetical protein
LGDLERSVALIATTQTTYQYAEWIAGADLAIDWGRFRLRSEAVQRHVAYEDGLHEPHPSLPGASFPNRYEKYIYGVAAYRVGAFEPFVHLEFGDRGLRTNYLPDSGSFYSAGLNLHLSPVAQVKTQVGHTHFTNITGANDVDVLLSRLVLVF